MNNKKTFREENGVMENIKEEVQYCTSCGAVNKQSASFCEECNKKIILRHRPVVDFLKKRVKGKATGEVTERLFSLIKDFLFDHLYGVILTVSVGVAATTAVVTSTPHIKEVTAPPFEKTVISATTDVTDDMVEETGVDPEYAEWCEMHAIVVMSNYMDYSDYVVWAHDGYTTNPDNVSLDEIYAERAIPGFNHQGVHEMMTVRVPLGKYHEGSKYRPLGMTETQECVKGSYKFGENVASSLGQTLHAEGYEVMECNFAISLYEGRDSDGTRGTVPVEKEEFRVLFVRNGENSWCIAEEILVDRIKGDTYDLYMKYGVNGYTIDV